MDPNVAKIEEKMGDLKVDAAKPKKDINILLLGETGVGKSTFINSVFNYLHYQDFAAAERQKLYVLIPSTFSMFDKDGNMQTIKIGAADKNESVVLGESATQDVKTYTFLIKNGQYQVRLIDTPGMGDTRGIEQDDLNCENILNYISNIDHLHAICYLCKPQQSRANSYFQYCMAQIMTRLHADACKNFVFVFTGSKAENYTPGETFQMLKKIANEISKKPAHAKLKLDDNKFCFDNEAFRYLAAVKQGVNLTAETKKDAIKSWTKATQECWKMIDYITKLKPHQVKNTSAINDARRVIYNLSKPMADITQLVQDNILALQRHKRNMEFENNDLQELKAKLHIPSIELQVTRLTQPVTVCADIKCCELYKVDDRNEYHYKTRCHDPCYLQNVQREVIGAPQLMNCSSMNYQQLCKKCGCSYKVHMHVYYFTRKNRVNKMDMSVLQNINTREEVLEETKKTIAALEDRKQKHERELEIITSANAKFAHFLEKNAIAAFTDAYAEYIQYLIVREKSLGKDCNSLNLTALETLLRQHNEQKNVFDIAAKELEKQGRQDPITPESISQTMSELFKLELNGKNIKSLYNSQKPAMKKEHANTEYTHTVTFNKVNKKQPQSKPTNPGRNPVRSNNNRQRNRSEVRHVRSHTPPPSYDASQQQASRQPPLDRRSTPSNNYQSSTNDNPPPADHYSRPWAEHRPPSDDHRPSSSDYRPPPSDYRAPSSDYRPPPNDYRPPPSDYRPPASDYHPPPSDYRPPPSDYRPPPSDYRPPPSDYRPPPSDYRPPPNEYRSPPSDYRPPPNDYRPPPNDYRQPPSDYRPPPSDYRPPPSDYRPPPSDYRPPPSDYRPPPSDYRPPPSDYRPPTNDYRSPPNDYRPPPNDYRPPHSDYRPPPSNDRPPSYDHRAPPADYHSPPPDYHSRPSDYRPPPADSSVAYRSPPADYHRQSSGNDYQQSSDNRQNLRSNSPNRNRRPFNQNRQRDDHHNNNYRGKGRGGIERKYRKKDNNQRSDAFKKN
ncbi:uncharacterized protein LOC143200242 isoform X2 [Rhynchophorus ferrugineus]